MGFKSRERIGFNIGAEKARGVFTPQSEAWKPPEKPETLEQACADLRAAWDDFINELTDALMNLRNEIKEKIKWLTKRKKKQSSGKR
jgi:hypothetical protein